MWVQTNTIQRKLGWMKTTSGISHPPRLKYLKLIIDFLREWYITLNREIVNVQIVDENFLGAFWVLCFMWFHLGFCVSYGKNCKYGSYKFSYKFAFNFFSSRRIKQQNSNFEQVGGLVTRNISISWRVALYLNGMPNSIDFYKEIFLRVIPVHIIASWLC